LVAKMRIGGRVIVIFVTTLYEEPSGASINVVQPPLPHQPSDVR